MTKRVTQLSSLAAASLLTLAGSAFAEVKLNDNFSVAGYIEGSYQYSDPKPGASTDKFDIDTSLLLVKADFSPVKAVMSFYYNPNATNQLIVLDAYGTYDAGNGVSVTGGKFLSYLGYDSFFTINNAFVSYGMVGIGPLTTYPAYHDGVRVDYSDKEWSSGVALLDSVNSPYYLHGDGELKHNAGFEAYTKYTGVANLTVFAGFAYDTKGNFEPHSLALYNLWAQYQIAPETAFAAEVFQTEGGKGARGTSWLAQVTQKIDDKFSVAGRISGQTIRDGGPRTTKYSVAPSYAVTDHLTVRAEFSYFDYDRYPTISGIGASAQSKTYYAVQAFVKF